LKFHSPIVLSSFDGITWEALKYFFVGREDPNHMHEIKINSISLGKENLHLFIGGVIHVEILLFTSKTEVFVKNHGYAKEP
jgi:hypothetical protein